MENMSIVEQLGVALGLASMAGVNLYLTVLLAGLAVRLDWIHLADKYEALSVLGNPWIIGTAGVLFAVEFFADKVPWLDSAWDAIHTFIRPVGGTLVALQALGELPPHVQVVAGLLAGGAALTTHGAKAGTRLMINHSPEPVSNVAMSLAEDAAVVGGTALVWLAPLTALVVFSIILVVLWIILPKLWRFLSQSFRLLRNGFRPALAPSRETS
jgi:hypothetical protein